ncbi:unnamed protein product, partial [Mesorhabditis spiculigera]
MNHDFPADVDNSEIFEQLARIIIGDGTWSSTICSRKSAEFVWNKLLEGAKKGLTEDEFTKSLSGEAVDHTDSLAKVYEAYRDRIISLLSTIKCRSPELVDFKGRVIPPDVDDLSGEAHFAGLDVRYLEVGATSSTPLHLLCDRDQLMDMQHQLMEAQNFIANVKRKFKN